ncbi:hypothetical protein AB0K89_25250 [Streptomyces cinnamoneus]|uniref:hypothetical protein n=1 Tax=Streptomyces cinnamoneus TaxID=53446 RepID=UPI003438DA96
MPAVEDVKASLSGISLLLVFVMAFFSALYPQVREKLSVDSSDLGPNEGAALKARLESYRNLFIGVAVMDGLILLLISESFWQIVLESRTYWPWSNGFVMTYGVLTLVTFYTIILFADFLVNIYRLESRRHSLR